jgi:hypothetical protein
MSHAATFELSEREGSWPPPAHEKRGQRRRYSRLHTGVNPQNNEVFTLGATVPRSVRRGSAEADFEATKRLLSEDEATYLVLPWGFC